MIKSKLRRVRQWLVQGLARQEDLDRLYDQVAGLMQISAAMRGEPVIKPLRGWALSPDAMAWLLAHLQELDHPTVVEFGSGQSTVIFAAGLKHRNGRLVSIEHDMDYSASIQRQVAACGLTDFVDFVHAPLQDTNDLPPIRSYDLDALPAVEADLILIDGPPYTNGTLTRLIPLRWAAKHLKPGGTIFLDDAKREPEQACLEELKMAHPELIVTPQAAEKGLIELRLR